MKYFGSISSFDIESFINDFGVIVDSYTLIAFDSGVNELLEYIVNYDSRINRIVLIDCNCNTSFFEIFKTLAMQGVVVELYLCRDNKAIVEYFASFGIVFEIKNKNMEYYYKRSYNGS